MTVINPAVAYRPLPMPHDGQVLVASTLKMTPLTMPPDLQSRILARATEADVLVLPRDDPKGSYQDGHECPAPGRMYAVRDQQMVSELRALGARAGLLDPPTEREISYQFGWEIVVAVSLFLSEQAAGAALTGVIKYLRAQLKSARRETERRSQEPAAERLMAQISQIQRGPDGGETVTSLRIEGPAEDVLSALEATLRQALNPPEE